MSDLASLIAQPLQVAGSLILFALVPFVLVLMTSFTRISILLTFLRQALATSVPSTQIIIGLSLILTAYVMHPVIEEIGEKAVKPYLAGETKDTAQLLENGWPPIRTFMLKHTREKDLLLFLEMGHYPLPIDTLSLEKIPATALIPAFVISELRMAFLLGFLLFLPFLVIDLLVASLLMSMNMVMLPPVMISFPFKLLLFVVVDGWRLIAGQIVMGYAR